MTATGVLLGILGLIGVLIYMFAEDLGKDDDS